MVGGDGEGRLMVGLSVSDGNADNYVWDTCLSEYGLINKEAQG